MAKRLFYASKWVARKVRRWALLLRRGNQGAPSWRLKKPFQEDQVLLSCSRYVHARKPLFDMNCVLRRFRHVPARILPT